MLSNDCSIKLTLHSFYILFDYSWFIELELNWYKVLLFIQLFINQVLFFWLFCYHLYVVDYWPVCSHWLDKRLFILKFVLGCYLQIVSGLYLKWKYGFAPPAGLWKVITRFTVGCSYLFAWTDCFN